MPKEVKVFDIVNGHRVSRTVTIDPLYKVRFLGYPTNLKYEVAGKTYSYGDIADFVAGEYAYSVYVPASSSGDEFSEVKSSFVLSGGDLTLNDNLQVREVTMSVSVLDTGGNYLPNSSIYVDGIRKGISSTGRVSIKIPVGNRAVSREYGTTKGFVTRSFTNSDEGGNLAIILSSYSDLSKGYVVFRSDPPGAQLRLNNAVIGTTPHVAEGLSPTSYTYSMSLEDYISYNGEVRVEPGTGKAVNIKLEEIPKTGTVNFSSNQNGASLYLDGEYKGTMPVTLVLRPGLYKYSASKVGFNTKEPTPLAVQAGNTYPIYVELNAIQYPPRGQFNKFVCNGYDKYQELHDGSGGFMQEIVEKNSAYCNFPQTKTILVSSTVSATIDIINPSTGAVVASGVFKGGEGSYESTVKASFSLPFGTYKVKATPLSNYSNKYGESEITVTLPPTTGTMEVSVPLKVFIKKTAYIKGEFTINERNVSIFGDMNGFGGIVPRAEGSEYFEAYLNIIRYIDRDSNATMRVTCSELGYDSGLIKATTTDAYKTTGVVRPFVGLNVRNVNYQWSNVTITSELKSGQGNHDIVRSSEFYYRVEAWWSFGLYEGLYKVTVTVPVEYYVPSS